MKALWDDVRYWWLCLSFRWEMWRVRRFFRQMEDYTPYTNEAIVEGFRQLERKHKGV
jgi:hypothetical protein